MRSDYGATCQGLLNQTQTGKENSSQQSEFYPSETNLTTLNLIAMYYFAFTATVLVTI